MDILICYFSGTGNTEKIVKCYEENLNRLGHKVDLWKIEDFSKLYDINAYDKIGFAYPIHAFNAPKNMIAFAKHLKKANSKKDVFIIKSSGEPIKLNNGSSSKLIGILKRKNLHITNEYHYCMPYNMIFRHSNAMAYKMWDTAQRLIVVDSQNIVEGIQEKIKPVFMGRFISMLFRIEYLATGPVGKHYKIKSSCINCQQCIKNCPTKNISIKDGKFVFGNKCIMCMRCSFMCPTDAFDIGMFNGWKVNGRYDFNDPNNTEQKSHKNYCKKAYERYFANAEEKIRNFNKSKVNTDQNLVE